MAEKKSFTRRLAETFTRTTSYDQESNTLFSTNPGMSYDVLKGLAKKHNFHVGRTDQGEYISIPVSNKYAGEGEYVNFYDNMLDKYTWFDNKFSTLLAAYRTFDMMDENLAEVSLIFDTYVAEVLSQGFLSNPLKVKINDTKAQDFVNAVLHRNKIYQRLPNITRSLCKYGNVGMTLSYPYLNEWLNNENSTFTALNVEEDLQINIIDPKLFSVVVDEFKNPISYETTNDGNNAILNKNVSVAKQIWQPWQFVHFLLADETTSPYGKSMIWSLRSAFDQLTTLEALLGVCRASKIQRLVFYVPLPNGVAMTDAFGHLNEFKASYLNSVFTDTSGMKSGRKNPGATSILTLPETHDGKRVTVDHIESNIDLSSIEDVEYFLDKILRNSKLPKGYLVGEDIITTAQTLEAQDLKLKRALIPLKQGLLDGILTLVENVLAHGGYDVSKLNIEVSLNEPIQVIGDEIDKYKSVMELLGEARKLNEGMTTINQYQFLIKLGVPADISGLILSSVPVAQPSTVDDVASFLLGQTTKSPKSISIDDLEEKVGLSVTSDTFKLQNRSLMEDYKKIYDFRKTTPRPDRLLKEALYGNKVANSKSTDSE